MQPLLKYPGAKWRLADWIIKLMPRHSSYCEPFAGSASVFFNKPPAKNETLNDIDGDIVNFFRVLRNNPNEFAAALALTPYSREEYYASYDDAADTPLERARRYAVRCCMSFGASTLHKNGFRTGIAPTAPSPAKYWASVPSVVLQAAERLKNAQIENIPAEELIVKYNNPQTVIYCDPPYLLSTRSGKRYYKNEMTDTQHESLLLCLKYSKSKVILSGYDSELYNDMLRDWRKLTRATTCEQGLARTECLWLNYDCGLMDYLF